MDHRYNWITPPHVKGRHEQKKKRFLSGIALMRGAGLPMPELLALFQEVHFWSIKRVNFIKNAIYLDSSNLVIG